MKVVCINVTEELHVTPRFIVNYEFTETETGLMIGKDLGQIINDLVERKKGESFRLALNITTREL